MKTVSNENINKNNNSKELRLNPDWAKLPLFERKGWTRYRFDEIAENIRESVQPTPTDSLTYIGLEHMDTGSLHVRRWGSEADLKGQKLRMRKGDILFAKRNAYLRRVAIAPHDGLFSAHGMILRAKPKAVLLEFLPFFMMSNQFMNRAEKISVGSLSPTINWSTLKNEEFDLPPLDQQRRISDVLWAINEHAVAALEQLPRLQSYQRAIWESHKRGNDVQEVRVGDVADVANGSTPSRKDDRYWNNGSIPWLPTGKVHDRFIRFADEFITQTALNEKKARVFPKKSVLVAMIGQGKTRGSAALMEIDASVNQNFACIIPKEIDSRYLFFALDFSYEELRRSSHGSNQEALNCGLVSNFPIPMAPIKRQVEIAEELTKCERAQVLIKDQKSSAQKVLDEFINSLI